MQQTPHPPQGAGFCVLQLTVVKEEGGQLHQIAEAEIDHIQRADPVEGEGGLAVGKDGRAQQQEDQQPVVASARTPAFSWTVCQRSSPR